MSMFKKYKSELIFCGALSLITLTGCDNHNAFQPISNFNDGAFVTKLPSNTVIGDIYPVAFTVLLKQKLTEDTTTLFETQNMLVEYSSIDCLSTDLDDTHLCTVTFRVTPEKSGFSELSLRIGDQTYTNQTNATDSAIVGYVHTNLSQKFDIDKASPISFVFINTGQAQANNIKIKSTNSETLTNVKTTCSSTLKGGEACYLHGDYIPSRADSYGIQYELTYDEGEPVVVGTENVPKKDTLIGNTVLSLPLNIAIENNYNVEFQFKNMNSEPVVNLKTSLLAPGISHIRFNSCNSVSLNPGESCSMIASVLADQIGTLTAAALVYSDDGVTAYATTTSNVVEAPIVASVDQDIPQQMVLNEPYNYLVTFTNTNKNHDATGIRFAHLFPEHYEVLSNTCTDSTIRSEESCHLSISTSAIKPGIQLYANYLMFDQGTVVIANSTLSMASAHSLNSQVDKGFPDNMVLNHSYPFHVTFTNTSNVDTETLTITSEHTKGVTIVSNSCDGNILPAGESCILSGEYFSETLGPVKLVGNLNYGANLKETFVLSGEVVTVPIVGSIEVGLPQNVGLNSTYPIRYIYRNLSDFHDASMIHTTLSSTAPVNVTKNTCGSISTLAAGKECEISGTFTASEKGQHQFTSSLYYMEGNEVKIQSSAVVSDVVVSSRVEGGSSLVGLNSTYLIKYYFKNESIAPATGIKITHSEDLVVHTNTCGSILAGNSDTECHIEVAYTPRILGYYTYEFSLDYTEGEAIHLKQPVKVVDMIELDEMVFTSDSLSHNFEASDYFNYLANYGFTMQATLQTIPVSGNPETVIHNGWGSTDLVFELTNGYPINFIANRKNDCGTQVMNASVGCQSRKLPQFRLSIPKDKFDTLAIGEQSGDIYVSLTQSNNTHVALFKLPIRINKL